MNKILNLREKVSNTQKERVFKLAMPVVVSISLIQSITNLYYQKTYDASVILAFIEDSMIILAFLIGVVTKFKDIKKIMSFLIPIPIVCLFIRIGLAGGFGSTSATLWLFLFPIASAYFTSYRYTYIVSILMTIGVLLLDGLLLLSLGSYGDPTYTLGTIANIWFITLIICHYEINKDKALGIIDSEQRSRQLTTAHYSTSQIVQGFAHEINNPLCIINLFVQQLEFENKISEHEKNQIESNILRITDLISGLKERINRHNPRLSTKEIEAGAVIPEVLSFVREECDEKNIVLWSDLEIISRIKHPVVESEFFQAISFIVQNAMENVQDSEVKKVSLIYYEDIGQLHINDSGKEFSSESKTLALNTFYTTKSGHSGIGLSVAKELLKKNKISIKIEDSKNGKIVLNFPS